MQDTNLNDDAHAALREIHAGAMANGWHICSWSSLRTSTFPGLKGWANLKAWCEANDLDCALCFSHTSRNTEVQFRKLHRMRSDPMVAPA